MAMLVITRWYMANLTFRNAEIRGSWRSVIRSTALLAARINTLPGPARPWVVTSWPKIEMTPGWSWGNQWKNLGKVLWYSRMIIYHIRNLGGYTRFFVVYPFMSLGRLRDRLQMTPNCEDLSWYNSEGLIMVKPMLTGNGWPNDEKEHMHT